MTIAGKSPFLKGDTSSNDFKWLFFYPLSFGSVRVLLFFCCHHETNQVATGEHALADDDAFDPKAADESSKAACKFMSRCGNGQLNPASLW